MFLRLAVLDDVTRYTKNRVFAPRRFHTALGVTSSSLGEKLSAQLPATPNPGFANHTRHRFIDRMHRVPTTIRNHVIFYMMSAKSFSKQAHYTQNIAFVPRRFSRR